MWNRIRFGDCRYSFVDNMEVYFMGNFTRNFIVDLCSLLGNICALGGETVIKYALIVLAVIGAYAFCVWFICGIFKLNHHPGENGLEDIINDSIRSDGTTEN